MSQDPAVSLPVVREELAADVRRVADRLRGLSQARLAEAATPHASRAVGARRAAQALADAAQGIEERAGAGEPTWRHVPELTDFAVGDQVAVTGHDLLAALDEALGGAPDATPAEPAVQVWTRGGRSSLAEVVRGAAAQLADLRRSL